MTGTTSYAPIRLALIGAGVFARDAHIPSILRLGNRFHITVIYSRSAETAAAAASLIPYPVEIAHNLDALLRRDDVDACDIVLPIPVMPAVVEQALATGKHLLSEKPLAPDVTTGNRLLALQQPQQVWMVGENWRYESAFERAAEFVAAGAIGRPLTCHWSIYAPVTPRSKYYHSDWRRSSSFAGGWILDGGVHHVAALRAVVGEIVEVRSGTGKMAAELGSADTVAAALTFANGALGVYLASYAAAAPWPQPLMVVGERGSLQVVRGRIQIEAEGETRIVECPALDGVERELAAFADAIRGRAPHRNTAAAALADLAVIEAMFESAESGRAVRL